MARPLRIEYPGALYHITSRGNDRKKIYRDDEDFSAFLHVLASVIERYNWRCYAYCLMANHYHLVIETPEANLSRGMRQLNGVYTQRFNRTYHRTGHIFQGRFKAILVDRDSYLLELCRYVVLNPVRGGVTEAPEKWKWSSYLSTAGFGRPSPFLTTDWLLSQFHTERKKAQQRYRAFVLDGLTREAPWCHLKGQIYLGPEHFVEDHSVIAFSDLQEIPRIQREPNRPPLDRILQSQPVQSKQKRKQAIYDAHVKHGYTLKEIGAFLRIHYSTASRAVRDIMKTGENV